MTKAQFKSLKPGDVIQPIERREFEICQRHSTGWWIKTDHGYLIFISNSTHEYYRLIRRATKSKVKKGK